MTKHPGKVENLFSYRTLQTEAVQLELFGRKLEGRADVLVGYRLEMIQIQDQDFVVKSGAANHRNLQFTNVDSDYVEGPYSPSPRVSWRRPDRTSLTVINGC